MIPYGHQDISEADIQAVIEVLRSDWLTQGPAIERFERAVADYCGASYAVAVSNATAGLHLACRALGLGPGGLLWTSPNSFVASANCARYCGADVDFVDIDPATGNLSVSRLAEKLAAATRRGRLPDVIVPVHFAGEPCEMEKIRDLAAEHGTSVLEDAAHAIGASHRGSRVGSCAHSDAAVFSFHPVKVVTTGEGGMVLTNDPGLNDRLKLLRTHGVTRDPEQMSQPTEGPWYYEQRELGFNFRITDIQCALGTSQMRRLDEFVDRRHELARRYDRMLAGLPVRVPWRDPRNHSSLHLYVIRLELARLRVSRLEVVERMRAAGILVNVHYIPIHWHPYYRALGFERGRFPEAEQHYQEAITLPLFYGLSEGEQDRVVTALRESL
jgi:UDP-4-amino-4,6-dideoxy-N-acetyl-beta-L-altrosamine transaminase